MSRALVLRPHAKINLTLRVGHRLANGYHDVRTLMQAIGVTDTITFTPRSGPFALAVHGPGIPGDQTNLVWRAAEQLWRAAGRTGAPRDVHVKLDKAIPAAAGLGGGSANAAAALIGLNARLGTARAAARTDAARGRARGGRAVLPAGRHGARRGPRRRGLSGRRHRSASASSSSSRRLASRTADAYRWLDEDRAAGIEGRRVLARHARSRSAGPAVRWRWSTTSKPPSRAGTRSSTR